MLDPAILQGLSVGVPLFKERAKPRMDLFVTALPWNQPKGVQPYRHSKRMTCLSRKIRCVPGNAFQRVV